MAQESTSGTKWRRVGRRLVFAGITVVILGVVAVFVSEAIRPPEVEHLNPCKTEGRTLLVAVEVYADETGRSPTSVDDLLVHTKVGKVQGPILENRPEFWAIADNGHGTIVVRDGVELPSACRRWRPWQQAPH